MKELNRPSEDYAKLLTDWLSVPTLDFFQRSLVGELLKAAGQGIEAFDERRRFIHQNFHGPIWDAIRKARTAGVGQKWEQYA